MRYRRETFRTLQKASKTAFKTCSRTIKCCATLHSTESIPKTLLRPARRVSKLRKTTRKGSRKVNPSVALQLSRPLTLRYLLLFRRVLVQQNPILSFLIKLRTNQSCSPDPDRTVLSYQYCQTTQESRDTIQ